MRAIISRAVDHGESQRQYSIHSIATSQMIPDTETACQTFEAAVESGGDVCERIKDRPEKEAASVTAWKRYQRLVAAIESRGGEFNRKSMIEAIFRGSDLVYASHWSKSRESFHNFCFFFFTKVPVLNSRQFGVEFAYKTTPQIGIFKPKFLRKRMNETTLTFVESEHTDIETKEIIVFRYCESVKER